MINDKTLSLILCLIGGFLIGISTPSLRDSPSFWLAMLGGLAMYVAGTLDPLRKC